MTNKALHAFQFVTDDAPKSIFIFFVALFMLFSFEKLMENLCDFFFSSLKFRFMTFLIFHHPRRCAFIARLLARSMTVRQQKAIVILLWYLNSILNFILNPVRQRGTSDCVWFFVCSISLALLLFQS